MADPYLSISSEGGSLESNEIASTGVGVEVRAGVTGLGLPPVSLQFDESAGDGARYRGRRVQQRTLDVEFHIYGPNRTALKATVDRVSQTVAYPCIITWNDPDVTEEWNITGYRSGGGDFAYGVDSDGRTWVNIPVTFTTDTPYWSSSFSSSASRSNTSGNLTLNNTGTASAPPVWTLVGPMYGFKATSPAGEVLSIPGLIDRATTLTIDCGSGTVTDSHGVNRYNDLGPLPRFWHVPDGSSSVPVVIDMASADYAAAYAAARRNFVTNPNLFTNSTGWTLTGFTYDSTNKRFVQDATTAARPKVVTTCTGLTPGKNYVVRVNAGLLGPAGGRILAGAEIRTPQIQVIDGGVVKLGLFQTSDTEGVFEFTADNATVTLEVYPNVYIVNSKSGAAPFYQRGSGWFDNLYLGDPGPYFDGDTTDTAQMTYAWVGTARASVSTATPPVTPSTGASVSVSFKPRKWLVI